MKKHITVLSLFLLFFSVSSCFAQISVSAYSTDAISVGTGNNKRISGELKGFLNLKDQAIEPALMFNFKQKQYHQFSIGIGSYLHFFDFTAVTIPLQLEVTPFEKIKFLSAVLEVSPLINSDYVDLNETRSLLGIRYSFQK